MYRFKSKKFNFIPQARMNNNITAPSVRLIDENGVQVGVIDKNEALRLAQEKGMDLIEVSSKINPPICKILDYGKYRYQKQKQEQKAKKKQKKSQLKGIRLSLRIGKHDLEFKARQAEKFLNEGHKVKIEIILKGREFTHLDLAFQELKNFQSIIAVPHKIEQFPKKLGDRIISVLSLSK